MRRIVLACLWMLASFALAQDDGAQDDGAEAETVAAVLAAHEELSTFTELLESTGILIDLGEPGLFTIFAPTNDAFAALDQEAFTDLLNAQGVLEVILRNHIARGGSGMSALSNMNALTNVAGHRYLVTQDGDALYVDAAQIVVPDLRAENGVVHVIDDVLIPELYWPRKNQSTIPAGGTANDTE